MFDPYEDDEDEDNSWPGEPDEFDPDSLGPSVEIPEAPHFSDADVPADLFHAFWATVLMANIGLFAVSLGVMLVVFREQYQTGGVAIAIGTLALLFGYRYYRNYRQDHNG